MIVLFRPVLFRTQKKFKGSKPEFVASYGDTIPFVSKVSGCDPFAHIC
jgi:hypothetical protein